MRCTFAMRDGLLNLPALQIAEAKIVVHVVQIGVRDQGVQIGILCLIKGYLGDRILFPRVFQASTKFGSSSRAFFTESVPAGAIPSLSTIFPSVRSRRDSAQAECVLVMAKRLIVQTKIVIGTTQLEMDRCICRIGSVPSSRGKQSMSSLPQESPH